MYRVIDGVHRAMAAYEHHPQARVQTNLGEVSVHDLRFDVEQQIRRFNRSRVALMREWEPHLCGILTVVEE